MQDCGKLDAIRNPQGIWINTSCFKEVGSFFSKNGYYCPDPWGSPDWKDFWQRERNRCLTGYTVGGASITGDHYFYLNYCPIQKVEDTTKKTSRKITEFPDFWDGDYNYYWSRQIARSGIVGSLKLRGSDISLIVDPQKLEEDYVINLPSKEKAEELKKLLDTLYLEVKIVPEHLEGGYNLIVGKSRRKGYSYKNSSIAANNFFHRRNSYTMFMAYDKKYLFPKGIFGMSKDYINFINDQTGWSMPSDVVDRQDHIKASYIDYKNGIKLEKGFKSEIQAISFKDDPDKGRGKDAYDIIGEEVGAWGSPGGLKDALNAMQDSVKAGNIKTGMITFFGTSGDIEGGTADFASMHNRPLANEFLPFYDVWGQHPEKVEGFFHPTHWNMEGYYDKQGNSNLEAAKQAELLHRESMKNNGATSLELQSRMQEHPLDSAEAFSIISFNNFPVVELKNQLEKVKAKKLNKVKGVPVELYYVGAQCLSKPILDGSIEPISSLMDLPLDRRGCVVIYEQPIIGIEKGTYKIGYDPVRQDNGTSLAGIIVYKSVHVGSVYHSIIVAEYIGRLESPDDIDHVAEKLADYYNTTIMHENEVTGVKNYFRRKKRLNLLAHQPDKVISKNIAKSEVARVYGCHMTEGLKDAGERYVKDWLIEIVDYDENGDPIRNLDRIYSIRLLEELIAYNRKGNFDLVSALFMCMFQVQEQYLGKEYGEQKKNKNAQDLLNMMKDMYNKNNKL